MNYIEFEGRSNKPQHNIRRTSEQIGTINSLDSGSRTEALHLRYRIVKQATMIFAVVSYRDLGKEDSLLVRESQCETGQRSGFFFIDIFGL